MNIKSQRGFTFIELLIVIGIMAVLIGFASVNATRVVSTTSLDNSLQVLITDIRQQQTKAMVGDTEGAPVSSAFGIRFEANRYTLFRGATYSASDPQNFVVVLDEGVQIQSIQFPSQQLVFNRLSGEVNNFNSSLNSFVLSHPSTSQTETISISKYGVISIQ